VRCAANDGRHACISMIGSDDVRHVLHQHAETARAPKLLRAGACTLAHARTRQAVFGGGRVHARPGPHAPMCGPPPPPPPHTHLMRSPSVGAGCPVRRWQWLSASRPAARPAVAPATHIGSKGRAGGPRGATCASVRRAPCWPMHRLSPAVCHAAGAVVRARAVRWAWPCCRTSGPARPQPARCQHSHRRTHGAPQARAQLQMAAPASLQRV
jgi:hypothetical protein